MPTDAAKWPEMWIANENDYEKAIKLANEGVTTNIHGKWKCHQCSEIKFTFF